MLSLELPLSLLPENTGLEIEFWNPIGTYTRLHMKQVFLASCFWKTQVQMSHIFSTESEVLTTTEATDLTPEWYPHKHKFYYSVLHEAQTKQLGRFRLDIEQNFCINNKILQLGVTQLQLGHGIKKVELITFPDFLQWKPVSEWVNDSQYLCVLALGGEIPYDGIHS